MIIGCDISHWDGKRIDFNKMKSAGAKYVIIKATDFAWKSGVDDTFFLNIEKAKLAGLLVGAYHWWKPDNKFGVEEQAGLFHSVVGDICDLPPTLDVEVAGTNRALWTSQLFAMVRQVEEYFHRKPIIYTSNYVWKSNSINYDWAKKYPLWIAHYQVKNPTIPAPWDNWTMWQFSATENSEKFGINSNDAKVIDVNYFNGSLEELKLL